MNNIKEIINFNLHPIDDFSYINKCKKKINSESILILDNFLNIKSLNTIIAEAKNLEEKAFYCSQNHTILLLKKNESESNNDPLNVEVKSDKGCIPHDLIDKKSHLNILYYSESFRFFLKKILNLKNIFSYCDSLSSINYNYYQKNQQLGWHFDNASFAITLMVQSPEEGGEFQYINKGRDFASNYIDKKYIKEVIDNNAETNNLNVAPGTLVLFYGRNYLHRVTKVKSTKPRILVTLNYNEEDGIELSENARLTFFGRKF
tara:strand:+ start:1740 stop:2522 length:783 start_codon:yes stop_codon:yes gene_type:complete